MLYKIAATLVILIFKKSLDKDAGTAITGIFKNIFIWHLTLLFVMSKIDVSAQF
jgi:hypothetical protein